MSDQMIVERAALAKKEKGELQAIIEALGATASSRARKDELINQILQITGAEPAPSGSGGADPPQSDNAASTSPTAADSDAGPSQSDNAADNSTGHAGPSASTGADADSGGKATTAQGGDATLFDQTETTDLSSSSSSQSSRRQSSSGGSGGQGNGRGGPRTSNGSRGRTDTAQHHPVGPDGEPLADWEVDIANGDASSDGGKQAATDRQKSDNSDNSDKRDDTDPNNRRNRRRTRGRGRDRDDAGNEPVSTEPIPVAGYLDLRDEGYGFLRVNGNLPSKEDVYVSVKQVRQYGLRKGDHITGRSRPANRNEKNPGFHQIDTVNGGAPTDGRDRPRFDDLTPIFPSERLLLEQPEEDNITARVIDLVAPIGKGQRGLIVAPPKTDKTQVIKDIARAIATNNPEVRLMVLLVDERPEEVTDIRRHLDQLDGDVADSTFDRPPEEHCAVADLTLEKAKRMAEAGHDVCVVVDGMTRLARAYNLSVVQNGRSTSSGIDAGAIHPAKRFFGAARNLEEGGSLTMLATALVDTGSKVDETIFDELKDTANMELWLDRRLADKRITPAIDLATSSTRHEELLFAPDQMQASWNLRRGAGAGAAAAADDVNPIEALIDTLKTYPTNQAFIDGTTAVATR